MIEEIVDKLEELLVAEYNTYLDPALEVTAKNIVPYILDLDKNKQNIAIFILPEGESSETVTFGESQVQQRITLYFICRNATEAVLIGNVMKYSAAFKMLIKNNPELDGLVGETEITGMEYYHAVEGTTNIKGSEISLIVSHME